MTVNRKINFVLIMAGSVIAIYAKADEDQNAIVLIVGLAMLMTGLYRLSRGITDRKRNSDNDNNIEDTN